MFKFLRKSLLYIVIAPYLVVGLGIASNQAVLWANNDTFPVRINPVKLNNWTHEGADLKVIAPGVAIIDDIHCVMTKNTHLNWLADNFDFHSSILSIGDFLVEFGVWLNGFSLVFWAGALSRKLFAE